MIIRPIITAKNVAQLDTALANLPPCITLILQLDAQNISLLPSQKAELNCLLDLLYFLFFKFYLAQSESMLGTLQYYLEERLIKYYPPNSQIPFCLQLESLLSRMLWCRSEKLLSLSDQDKNFLNQYIIPVHRHNPLCNTRDYVLRTIQGAIRACILKYNSCILFTEFNCIEQGINLDREDTDILMLMFVLKGLNLLSYESTTLFSHALQKYPTISAALNNSQKTKTGQNLSHLSHLFINFC